MSCGHPELFHRLFQVVLTVVPAAHGVTAPCFLKANSSRTSMLAFYQWVQFAVTCFTAH